MSLVDAFSTIFRPLLLLLNVHVHWGIDKEEYKELEVSTLNTDFSLFQWEGSGIIAEPSDPLTDNSMIT